MEMQAQTITDSTAHGGGSGEYLPSSPFLSSSWTLPAIGEIRLWHECTLSSLLTMKGKAENPCQIPRQCRGFYLWNVDVSLLLWRTHRDAVWEIFTQGGAGSETCIVSSLISWRTQTLSGRIRWPEHSRYKKTCYAQGHTEIEGRRKEGNTNSLAFRSGHLPSSNSKCPWHNTSSPFRRIQCHLCSMWLSRSKLKISHLFNKGKLMLTTCSLLGTLQASNWF